MNDALDHGEHMRDETVTMSRDEYEAAMRAAKVEALREAREGEALSPCVCYGADGVIDQKCPACVRADEEAVKAYPDPDIPVMWEHVEGNRDAFITGWSAALRAIHESRADELEGEG